SSTIPHIGGQAYGEMLYWTGSAWATRATSTLALNTTDLVEGNNLFFTNPRVQSYLNTIDKGYFFSTTSADAFLAQRNLFSTTSTDYWKTQNNFFSTSSADYLATQRNSFSTSSAAYFLSQNQTAAFATTSADFFASQRNFFSTTSADF